MNNMSKHRKTAGLGRVAVSSESEPNLRELAKLLRGLEAGSQLTNEQHVILADLLDMAAEREPAMVAQVAFKQEIYSGPLPHHEQLNGYDEQTRSEIVLMAKLEQAHAHDMDRKGLNGAILKDRFGQMYGFGIAISGLAAAAWISQYSAVAAAIIGTLDLLGMVCAFVAPRVLENAASKRTPSKIEEIKSPKPPRKK